MFYPITDNDFYETEDGHICMSVEYFEKVLQAKKEAF